MSRVCVNAKTINSNSNEYYFEIPKESKVSDKMYHQAINAHKDLWGDFYNLAGQPTVKVLVAEDDWEIDSWWRHLYKAHPFTAGIAKLKANTYYDWHIDTDRGVRVNMLLNNWDTSHCMFNPNMKRGESDYNIQLADLKQGEREFVELKYTPQRYYLFNTQVAHTIYNFNEPRYLLTLDFDEDITNLTYKQLLEELIRERWWEK